jgi:hypothetical protein
MSNEQYEMVCIQYVCAILYVHTRLILTSEYGTTIRTCKTNFPLSCSFFLLVEVERRKG